MEKIWAADDDGEGEGAECHGLVPPRHDAGGTRVDLRGNWGFVIIVDTICVTVKFMI